MTADPLVQARDVTLRFDLGGTGLLGRGRRWLTAVDGVSLDIHRGEIVGLIGESGSGKSTFGRCLLRIHKPTSGEVRFDGGDVASLDGDGLRRFRQRTQMIFQDSFSALNPRMTVGGSIAEHLHNQRFGSRVEIRARVAEMLDLIGLSTGFAERYPHELSGGQRQRVVIARAISTGPDFVVADEPVSALDVSIRAQIINLIRGLQQRMNLALLFISHDLSIIAHVSQRIAVMYLGELVEIADRETLFRSPLHPYTHALLSAVPLPDPKREKQRRRLTLVGEIPSPTSLPNGCRLQGRCPRATDRCRQEAPDLAELAPGHRVACHHPAPPAGDANLACTEAR
jgi:oligopeptide transport system ATP-binding protein